MPNYYWFTDGITVWHVIRDIIFGALSFGEKKKRSISSLPWSTIPLKTRNLPLTIRNSSTVGSRWILDISFPTHVSSFWPLGSCNRQLLWEKSSLNWGQNSSVQTQVTVFLFVSETVLTVGWSLHLDCILTTHNY